MEKTLVAQAIPSQASQAGALFAKSEIDATQALEVFARSIGTDPTYTAWIANRTDWINGYVLEKPHAKGNSADQAFTRFARRLNESFGIVAPKAQTEASIKKANERAKKAEELNKKFENITTEQLASNLRQAYELQAKNPTKKLSTLKELETILKARTKAQESESKEELKTARARLFALAKACTDVARIETACDVLDEVNYEIEIS